MRKFYLEKETGARLSFNDFQQQFMISPSGLGVNYGNKYTSIEPGFFTSTSIDENQVSINGVLLFIGENVYARYQEITDWIFTAKSLKFVYVPYNEKEYFRDIEISEVQKGERSSYSVLEIPIKFLPLTPWYDKYRLTFVFSPLEGDNFKKYPYKYSYKYAASMRPNSKDFQIDGHYPGEIEMKAYGPMTSPKLTLYSTQTNEILGQIDLSDAEIASGETLFFSSRVGSPRVYKTTRNSEVEDLVDVMHLSEYPSFFRVPPNTLVTLSLSITGIFESQATVDVYKYRKGV